MSAGDDHTCAIDAEGAIECWGSDTEGRVTDTPTGTGYTAVGAGWYHTCAINSSGVIECWGDDTYGQVTDAP